MGREAFVFCTPRSGSTLLRRLLGEHPMITAPHELHPTELQVSAGTFAALAMRESGLTSDALRHSLWRAYLDAARRPGTVLVEKSPSNAFHASEIARCWPEASAIVLRRDPRDTWTSFHELTTAQGLSTDEAAARLCSWLDAVDQAAGVFGERTAGVRYEDLLKDPNRTLCKLVSFLALPTHEFDGRYRPEGSFAFGLGDFGPAIRSGQVGRARRPSPTVPVPDDLKAKALAWGYT